MRFRETSKEKVLLLLLTGITLGLTRSPKQYFYIIKKFEKAWCSINRADLYRAVREFYRERLVSFHEKSDRTIEVVLTKKGRKRALRYKLENFEIKIPKRWDKKWRLVIFDIPEKKRLARDIFRRKLKEIGFHELQKSVFVHPFKCESEINFLVEVYNIRPYVRFINANKITNEEQLKIKFELE